jgi:hypothetical protein
MEKWKDIKGYEGVYQVSDLGRVKSLRYGNILNPYIGNHGYMVVNLSENKRRTTIMVHILVAESFLNHSSNRGYVVDHINNNQKDNTLSNLQVITHRENCTKDRKKNIGTSYNKNNNKWIAMISIDKKQTYLGSFDTEERASIAYDFALTQLDKLKEYNLTR